MTTPDWINIIAAILVGGGTFFLGIMAWRTIRQTRSIQKSEKRERLLNEIIEWAISMSTASFGKDIEVISLKGTDLINALHFSLSSVRSRTEYTKQTASMFDKNLKDAVESASNELQSCLGFLVDCLETKGNPTKEVAKKIVNLRHSANKVIEEAARVKIKDIGKKEEEKENVSKEGEATGNDEPTLKDIEERLKRQDKKLDNSTYLSGYLFGATLVFIAFGLLGGRYVLTTELGYTAYAILLLIGGTGLMGFTWYKSRKDR